MSFKKKYRIQTMLPTRDKFYLVRMCMLTCYSSGFELRSPSVRTSTFTCGVILPAVFLFSNIGSHYVTQAGQELAIKHKLASNV